MAWTLQELMRAKLHINFAAWFIIQSKSRHCGTSMNCFCPFNLMMLQFQFFSYSSSLDALFYATQNSYNVTWVWTCMRCEHSMQYHLGVNLHEVWTQHAVSSGCDHYMHVGERHITCSREQAKQQYVKWNYRVHFGYPLNIPLWDSVSNMTMLYSEFK